MIAQKKMLVNATLTAVVLAVIGYFYAQVIAILSTGQPVARSGAVITPELLQQPAAPLAIVSEMQWRLPLTFAFLGFAFVVIGEGFIAFWKNPSQKTETTGHVSLDRPVAPAMTEAETQQALRAIEAQETIRIESADLGSSHQHPASHDDVFGQEDTESVFQTR